MTVVHGYGIENNRKYWHAKNSWPSSWGENGMVKILRGENVVCGIEERMAAYLEWRIYREMEEHLYLCIIGPNITCRGTRLSFLAFVYVGVSGGCQYVRKQCIERIVQTN